MTGTVLSIISVVGYVIGRLHAYMTSPVTSQTLAALEQVVQQNHLLEGHAKLQKLANGGVAVAKTLAAVDQALHTQATGGGPK